MNISAVKILKDFRGGSSLPVLVQGSNQQRYVIKWRGTAEGALASVTDLIATELARQIGIPVPQINLISISPELSHGYPDEDVRDLVLKSTGINLGIEFLHDATPFTQSALAEIDQNLRDRIFIFDLLLLNIDRIENNPNMLFRGKQLFCIDFSASIYIRSLLIENKLTESPLLALIRRHPFYSETVSLDDSNFEIDRNSVAKIVEMVPQEWLSEFGGNPNDHRNRLVERLSELNLQSREILTTRLSAVQKIPLLSTAERLANSRKNRDNFKMKFGFNR